MSLTRAGMGVLSREGQPASFESFYALQYPHTVRIVVALCGSWPIAEELTQEAFVRALRRWDELERMQRPDAWIRRVACNLATSRFRRAAAEARAMARLGGRRDDHTPEPMSQDVERFWELVRRLPRRQAQVAALVYADDLPIAAVAEVLGIAEGTVKATLHAARQRLADQYHRPEDDR